MRYKPAWVTRVMIMLILLDITIGASSQNSRFETFDTADSLYQISGKKLIIPALLAGYGFSQFMSEPVLDLNLKVREAITGRVTTPFHIDDYSQWAPAAAVYGFNLMGLKGKHNFIDRSVIFATSIVLMEVSVNGLKQLTHIQRPDGSSYNAFPSGHTATAFACAEFLYQEYKDVSVWYGIAGYTVAAGTGFMRMYNNRHWLTDVLAGAGFGILSTKMAYWMFPYIKRLLFKDMQLNISFSPTFGLQNGQFR